MKGIRFFLSTIILLVFAISCKEAPPEIKESIRPVKYEVVQYSNEGESRTFSGAAAAANEIELSFRGNGIITKLNAEIGQKVGRGELIATLDNVEAQLDYDRSVSAVKAALSALNTAKSSLERNRELFERGSYSLSDYENAKNAYQSALDQHESALRTKDIKESQIGYGAIYAPRDGIVADKLMSINENVSAGQVVVVLNAGKKMDIEVGLPGSIINKIRLGMPAEITISALGTNLFQGRVSEIAAIINANLSTFPVKIEIINATSDIRPGMVADVTFEFESKGKQDDLLIVPVKAVGEDANGNFVFVIQSDDQQSGTVQKRPIEIERLTESGFIVKSGLVPGDMIATAGLHSLLDNQKVKLQALEL